MSKLLIHNVYSLETCEKPLDVCFEPSYFPLYGQYLIGHSHIYISVM